MFPSANEFIETMARHKLSHDALMAILSNHRIHLVDGAGYRVMVEGAERGAFALYGEALLFALAQLEIKLKARKP